MKWLKKQLSTKRLQTSTVSPRSSNLMYRSMSGISLICGVAIHLWPHPNPGYSEQVEAVKLSLLADVAKSGTTFLTISDLALRIGDLWNGVLADDFVFSFRNSLEVKAYQQLRKCVLHIGMGPAEVSDDVATKDCCNKAQSL